MASSAAAAVKEALVVVAVCVVLLHSSTGHPQPPPPPPPTSHCPYTGHPLPPPPPPTPVPAPLPPAPAPAPVNCGHAYCFAHCTPICEAIRAAGEAKCKSDLAANFKSCYGDCISRVYVCHSKKACLHSSCAVVGQCSSCSSNHNATSCCQLCSSAVSPDYQRCQLTYNDRSVLYCVNNCQDSCYKNCTQGAWRCK